jgi:biotin transport system substrate-specific component
MQPFIGGDDTLKALIGNTLRTILFVIVIAVLAHILLPYPFLPSTVVSLQSVGIFLAGVLLGPVWGTAAAILVLIAGAVGLPVLHGGSGIEFLLSSPKSGYFLSYPLAAAAIGHTVHRGPELRDVQTVSLKVLTGALIAGLAVTNTMLTVGYMILMNEGAVEAVLITTPQFVPLEILKLGAIIVIIRTDLIAAV